jgi:YegS/Rv2252/BmrU family lipid kinase
MQRHLLYIINPISGTGNKTSLREVIESKTAEAGLAFTIQTSIPGGDYSAVYPLLEEKGITDIVIAGGDGTINQAISSLRQFNLPFGIVPCGSGNGLALSAGLSKDWSKALDTIFSGKSKKTDAFLINNHFACMLCGLGFDAQVAHDFANDPNRGLTTYIKKTVSHFFTAHAYPFLIRSHGRELKTEAFFISIANSNQFGNNFKIAPQARLTDGLLDIVIVAKQNKISMLLQSLRQVTGFNHVKTIEVLDEKSSLIYFQTEALEIENFGYAPLHIDGDPAATAAFLDVEIIPDCFRLIYP